MTKNPNGDRGSCEPAPLGAADGPGQLEGKSLAIAWSGGYSIDEYLSGSFGVGGAVRYQTPYCELVWVTKDGVMHKHESGLRDGLTPDDDPANQQAYQDAEERLLAAAQLTRQDLFTQTRLPRSRKFILACKKKLSKPVSNTISFFTLQIIIWIFFLSMMLIFDFLKREGFFERGVEILDTYRPFYLGTILTSAYALLQLCKLRKAHQILGLSRARFTKATTWIRLFVITITPINLILLVPLFGGKIDLSKINLDSIPGSSGIMPFLFAGALGLALGPGREHYVEILDDMSKAKNESLEVR